MKRIIAVTAAAVLFIAMSNLALAYEPPILVNTTWISTGNSTGGVYLSGEVMPPIEIKLVFKKQVLGNHYFQGTFSYRIGTGAWQTRRFTGGIWTDNSVRMTVKAPGLFKKNATWLIEAFYNAEYNMIVGGWTDITNCRSGYINLTKEVL